MKYFPADCWVFSSPPGVRAGELCDEDVPLPPGGGASQGEGQLQRVARHANIEIH